MLINLKKRKYFLGKMSLFGFAVFVQKWNITLRFLWFFTLSSIFSTGIFLTTPTPDFDQLHLHAAAAGSAPAGS